MRIRLPSILAAVLLLAAAVFAATPPQPITAGKMVRFGDGEGYLVQPAAPGPHPAVIVIQEWWGLNAWVKQQARRLARQGYVALAPDLYHGQVATTPRQARALVRGFNINRGLRDLESAFDYLWRSHAVQDGRVGEIGWCFGGGLAAQLAEREPLLKACVIYYGDVPTGAAAGRIRCPVLGNFGGADRSIPPSRAEAFARAVRAAGVPVDLKIYPGMPHAFAHLTTPAGRAAAADAWARTLAFFAQHLRG